ncbi:ORF-95 [Catopsilia pomona nucleopolyhedrovirus]|uniref:ORF-95 n=1 Tax=Catopsilia pomona nucleopolyhedrovirus TaxID=1850906 RepID=A0A172WZH2_9ABAC|nr:ORF-95 [Catopsilia pomona nucleopolyhedrovirus]ANF29743.1 ORF-95 [Catopsilia pomona nucleopolyhedrovirus]
MNNKYANCYLCDEIVYLYKKQFSNLSAAANAFYRQHMAIIRNGFVICSRCNCALNKNKNVLKL